MVVSQVADGERLHLKPRGGGGQHRHAGRFPQLPVGSVGLRGGRIARSVERVCGPAHAPGGVGGRRGVVGIVASLALIAWRAGVVAVGGGGVGRCPATHPRQGGALDVQAVGEVAAGAE